jgi:hypothetical protein
MNENNPKVALTNEQRETLAGTLDIFAEALRERRELRAADFRDLIAEVRHFQQHPTACHPDLEYRLDCGRTVYVEEIRITASTTGYIAGSKAAILTDAIERYPKTVREQFPGRAVYRVRPIPEGELPAFVFIVALVCYPPVSNPAADSFRLTVSWLSDDLSSLPELIEREIRDIEWDWMARSKGSSMRCVPAKQQSGRTLKHSQNKFVRGGTTLAFLDGY